MSAMGFVFVVALIAALCLLQVEGARENKNVVSLQPLLTRERRGSDVTLQSLLTRARRDDDVSAQSLLTRARRDDDVSAQSLLTRARKDDDVSVQSLATLVQQQAAVIQRQESALQAMGAQVAQLQTSVTALQTQVYFTAEVTRSSVTMSSATPLRFETALNNVGSGYSAATGVFRAPEAGTYVFYAQLMRYNSQSVAWVIVKAGAVLCVNRLEQSGPYDTSSCLATVALQKGEEVFVRGQGVDTAIEGGGYSSFSGFRLP